MNKNNNKQYRKYQNTTKKLNTHKRRNKNNTTRTSRLQTQIQRQQQKIILKKENLKNLKKIFHTKTTLT
jgi:hypothetical protein